jgi:hypothetical protein
MNSTNKYTENYFAIDNSEITVENSVNKLPSDVLKFMIDTFDLDLLKNLNQTNTILKIITNQNSKYALEKINQIFAKQITFEFQPFINIVQYHESNNTDIYAKEQCEGTISVQLDENTKVNIDFKSINRRIKTASIKSFIFKNYFSGYNCRYTNRAVVKNIENDKNIEKAINISQKQINKLIKANFDKAIKINI